MSRPGSYWEAARSGALPTDRPLAELTVELTRMLGDPDPEVREATAVATLTSWISQGVYDDLLVGLADGMAAGLASPTATVERRCGSARVLTSCLRRATQEALAPPEAVLRWSDQVLTWIATETDPSTLATGLSALRQVALSAALDGAEAVLLIEVLADRISVSERLDLADLDAVVAATVRIIDSAHLPVATVEPLIVRLGRLAATDTGPERTPENFLRALYTHLTLTQDSFTHRADLILLLVEVLREVNPGLAGRTPGAVG